MTTIEKNKDVMGNSVAKTFTDFNSTWSDRPSFVETVNQHTANMADILNWANKQGEQLELRGLIRDKNLLRLVMVDTEMLRIIAAIKAVGLATGNNQLVTSVDKSRSELLGMSDTAFNVFAGVLKGIAHDNSGEILPLGIEASMLTNYDLSCVSFDSIMKKPKAMKSLLKSYTNSLKEAVLNMVNFLFTIGDNHVKAGYWNTAFSEAYFNSRNVYHINEERTELKGTVTTVNGHHIKNAIIELVNYPTTGESLFRHTNTKGFYAFRQMDLDSATIRIRAVGYIMAEYTVKIERLKSNDFDIVMIEDPAYVAVPA